MILEYNANLFVDRPTIRGKIEQWADGALDKRLFSVIGPPGSGKTWLLKDLYEKWKGETNSGKRDRLVFWLDVPEVVNRGEKQRDLVLNKEEVFKWLERTREEALENCPEIREIDRTVEPSRAVEDIVDDLCQPGVLEDAPIFILDRYDEVPKLAAEVVCDRLIRYLTSRECTRVLMAYRAEIKLYFGVPRFNQHSESMESKISAEEQFRRLAEHHGVRELPSNLDDWKASLKNYPWTHPFINAFFFECAWQGNGQPLRPLTAADLRQCCEILITRPDATTGIPRYHPLSPNEFNLLKQIANKCRDEWAEWELEEYTGQKSSSEMIKRLANEYGLIANIPKTPRQKIADGLRELLRDL